METKESQLEDYQVNLLARFKALFNELKTQQTRKDVEDFFDVFIEVSYENWTDKEIDEIDNIMVSLPNEIVANAAEYLRVGTGSSIDWEFILLFWIIEPYFGKRKKLFLGSFLKILPNEDLSIFLYKAYEEFSKENYGTAIEYLENLASLDKKLWTPRFLMAEIYQQNENYKNALIQSKLALKLLNSQYELEQSAPENESLVDVIWNYQIDIHTKISFFYEKTNDYKNAFTHLEILIEKDVDLSNLYGHTSYICNRIGKHQKAIKYANEEIEISNAEYAHWNKIEGLRKLGKKKEALIALDVLSRISKKKKTLANERNLINKIKLTTLLKSQENKMISETTSPKLKNKFLNSRGKRKSLEREDILENLLFLRITSGTKTFEKELEVFENDYYFGKQLFVGKAGILDLLLVEKKKNILWVVELKRNHDYNDAFEQTQRYMTWVTKSIAKKGQMVKGIICLFKPSELLLSQVAQSSDIELHTYEFSFNKLA